MTEITPSTEVRERHREPGLIMVHMNVFGVAASVRETWRGWVTC